jgi:hypothetical protein
MLSSSTKPHPFSNDTHRPLQRSPPPSSRFQRLSRVGASSPRPPPAKPTRSESFKVPATRDATLRLHPRSRVMAAEISLAHWQRLSRSRRRTDAALNLSSGHAHAAPNLSSRQAHAALNLSTGQAHAAPNLGSGNAHVHNLGSAHVVHSTSAQTDKKLWAVQGGLSSE